MEFSSEFECSPSQNRGCALCRHKHEMASFLKATFLTALTQTLTNVARF
jgi:hypothetical protein